MGSTSAIYRAISARAGIGFRAGVCGTTTYGPRSRPNEGASLIVVYPSPTRGFLGRISATLGFLQSECLQFLMAGAIAAVIALGLARWLARGMTQPLRDMAEAARRMETGDYSTRVHTNSRDEVGQLAAAFNRMSAELEQPRDVAPRSGRQRLARAQDADHRDPGASGEPARRRGGAEPRGPAGDAGRSPSASAASWSSCSISRSWNRARCPCVVRRSCSHRSCRW